MTQSPPEFELKEAKLPKTKPYEREEPASPIARSLSAQFEMGFDDEQILGNQLRRRLPSLSQSAPPITQLDEDFPPPRPFYRDIHRMPKEVLVRFVSHANELLEAKWYQQMMLAFSGGSFICFGAMLSIALSTGVEAEGPAKLLTGLGFASGFTMVILSGSALFTEINVILPEWLLASGKDWRWKRLWTVLKFWAIAWISNLFGAFCVGLMINLAGLISTPEEEARLIFILQKKHMSTDLGALGWFQVVISAILGNWLVGMAAFFATEARTLISKIMGVFFPVLTFVAIGVQHSPANMGYIAIGLLYGAIYKVDVGVGPVEAFFFNIIPASIGNLIGASLFVAVLFWFAYGSVSLEEEGLESPQTQTKKREVDLP